MKTEDIPQLTPKEPDEQLELKKDALEAGAEEWLAKLVEEINSARLVRFTLAVKLILCLGHDDFNKEILESNNVVIQSSELDQLQLAFPTRAKIVEKISLLLSEIKNGLSEEPELEEQIGLAEYCYPTIHLLHDLVMKDFSSWKNPDIIDVLIEHKLSPIAKVSNRPNSSPDEQIYQEKIQKIQIYTRSKQREKLHHTIFGKMPTSFETLALKGLLPKNEGRQRLAKIIYELINANAIISEVVNHWTTRGNFEKIVATGHFYGNEILKWQGVFFQKNALGEGDITNGDGKVICFCPFLVDPLAWDNDKKLKKDLIRLRIDVNKTPSFGLYNQFFKLFDLCCPVFSYKVKITNNFEFSVERKPRYGELLITLKLDDECVTIPLYDGQHASKHNMVCYGNLYSINRFCLNTVLAALNKCDNETFKNKFLIYLMSKDDKEIKKILTILGQSLTVFSEYNFNASLSNSDNLITSIHDVEKSVTYDLSQLPPQLYQSTIEDLAKNKAVEVPIVNEQILWADSEDKSRVHFGSDIECQLPRNVIITPQDFSMLSPELFSSGTYVETRPVPDGNKEQLDHGAVAHRF